MLFDLRGRGRRRTVRVIYIGLAVLIGVGLVGFGVGGGFGGGGLLTAANQTEGSGGASHTAQIKRYEKITRQQPTNLAAWEGLTKNLLQEAGNEGYITSSGELTEKGKEVYRRAASAWSSYYALNPPRVNPELAQLMVRVYGVGGLEEPAKAVQVLQIVVTNRPHSAAFYSQLAEYAYKAKNVQIGDLAAAKAVALAPATERVRVKNELAEVKRNPSGERTFTTTTNGKTYAVKRAPNGTYTGTEIPSTKAPSSTTTTPKK
jgi:hypothetical protein